MRLLTEYLNKSKQIIPDNSLKKCKIAFLSNFTINGLGETIKVLCNENGIYTETYTSNYNQYNQEILNESSKLYEFNPNIAFLLIDLESILKDFYNFPYRLTKEERKEKIEQLFHEIKNLITIFKKNTKSKLVINNFLIPIYSSKGILENKQSYGVRESINHLNKMLEKLAREDSQIFIFDINLFMMKKGYDFVKDNKMNYLADMKFSSLAIISLAEEYLAYIFPLMSMTKKCIVLDLDNTLWGGIIGEDGIEKIKLGPEKQGKPFLDFQKKLLELSERGIVLAINSKNNFEDAMNVIRNHPYMILKEDNFISVQINWNDKATNLRKIAEEINIGIDSFVFIDDDKTNREFIKKAFPEVFAVELPEDPSDYVKTLESLKIFNSFSITKEDLGKQQMYLFQKKRNELEKNFSDLNSFLKELNIEIEITDINKFNLPRASQLTQKTNQFNLTTKRYNEEDIINFQRNNYLLKLINVKDRFGDYGITGLAIIKKEDFQTWNLDTFLLSCRILGKNIEFAFLQEIINYAKKQNIKKIKAEFIPTKKNAPAENFLKQAGFNIENICGEKIQYILEVGKEIKKEIYANIKC